MVTVRDLPDQARNPELRSIFLYCETCQNQVSADRGNFSLDSLNQEIFCPSCKNPMVLARYRTSPVEILKR